LEKLRSRRRLANQNDKISKRSEISSQEHWKQLKIAQLNEAEESQEDKRSNRRVTQESPNPRSALFQDGDKSNLHPPSINRS
jgi:hypothetical protein